MSILVKYKNFINHQSFHALKTQKCLFNSINNSPLSITRNKQTLIDNNNNNLSLPYNLNLTSNILPYSITTATGGIYTNNNSYCSSPAQLANKSIVLLPNQQIRYYSTSSGSDGGESNELSPRDEKRKSLPTLMEFPQIVWPSVFKSIKNWILINFIVRPYFDKDFDMQEFIIGTKQALQVVSANLAAGDLKTLNGLIASEAFSKLQRSISNMSVAQRHEIMVEKHDIYLTFPYQVGIMFDDADEQSQKRFVEITMVFHVLRGLKEMQDQGITPPLNIGVRPEYRDKISICNYRFIKEFTQGNQSDWTINVVNHFKPADYIDE